LQLALQLAVKVRRKVSLLIIALRKKSNTMSSTGVLGLRRFHEIMFVGI
jgi:hypothetical protein